MLARVCMCVPCVCSVSFCYYYLRVQNFVIWGFWWFAGINFCDITKSNKILWFHATKVKAQLCPTCLVNVAVSRLNLLQCSVHIDSTWNMPNGAACTRNPVRTKLKFCLWNRYHQMSLSQARDGTGKKKRKAETIKREWLCMFQSGKHHVQVVCEN